MKKILITGGCGFFGHHAVEHFIKNTDWEIIVLDKLTYAANGFDRLRDIQCYKADRVKILTADFSQPLSPGIEQEIGAIDYILHAGAETHVDNSIEDPLPFVHANVVGTAHVLNLARKIPTLKKMVYFSTDEVFGPAVEGHNFWEYDSYNSTNPYAATKAGGEELAMAYANTYGVPVFITHTMNLFGERQHPEKFIPMCIKKILRSETVTIHANADKTKAGSRFYIHCRNAANAIHFLFEHGDKRRKYNIVGEQEVSNLEMATAIARILGKDLKHEMVDFHSSRPGHDLRYALDGTEMRKMGWYAPLTFDKSLENTIRWFMDNNQWLNI